MDAPVFLVQNAEHIVIAVIGGAGRHSACIPMFDAMRSVTRALKRRDGRHTYSVEDFCKR